MAKIPETENTSKYDNIEQMSTIEILQNINKEDATVAEAVRSAIPQVEAFVDEAILRMMKGGRLFYIGSGTSGRLGVVDASECPPTFGVSHDLVIGIIAGGDEAIRKAVEFAEDDGDQAWNDLKEYNVEQLDTVVGIAASGTTPYVIGGMKNARQAGLLTGCITCSKNSPLAQESEFPIEVPVGPEFITGSTRMKSGTAQKMVLNMISTSLMIKMGRIKGNKMVDMQLTNEKLFKRGVRMISEVLDVNDEEAGLLLQKHQSVRSAIESHQP